MKKSKFLLFILISSFLLLSMNAFVLNKKVVFTQIEVFTINENPTDLKVTIQLDQIKEKLIFNSLEKIQKITIYDFNGKKKIVKVENNQISLKELKGNQYYLALISKQKHTLKTIFLK